MQLVVYILFIFYPLSKNFIIIDSNDFSNYYFIICFTTNFYLITYKYQSIIVIIITITSIMEFVIKNDSIIINFITVINFVKYYDLFKIKYLFIFFPLILTFEHYLNLYLFYNFFIIQFYLIYFYLLYFLIYLIIVEPF